MEQEAVAQQAVPPDEHGNYICPECKLRYPERTVSYTSPTGLSSHRYWRHNVKGITPGCGDTPAFKRKYEKEADGTYKCPDCGLAGLQTPLLVGRHRYIVHGRRVNPAKQRKQRSQPPLKRESPPEPVSAPSMVAIYLFGRVEEMIHGYAKQNRLSGATLVAEVASLMLQSG